MKRSSTLNEEFDFSLFVYIAKKSFFWVVLIFSVSFTLAFLYARYSTEIYESGSIIQISKNETSASKILNISNPNEAQEEITSRLELMRSKVFLERVLKKL